MGLFGMYCGLLYNDCFSLGVNFFGSVYTIPEGNGTVNAIRNGNDVYPFGLDPIWHASTNELSFENSMKMKLSVVVGVIHVKLNIF